jgi:cobalt-zinc-cadmium efflux system protein
MLEEHDHDRAGSRRLGIALWLTAAFMVAEAVGGYLAGSLALLADAGHMLTDTAALAMAFLAARLSARPADPRRSYGYQRVRVLAALVNSLALLALVAWLVVEALQRLFSPQSVDAPLMLLIAVLGAGLNLGVAALLRQGHGHAHDINLSAAYAHVLSDLAGSLAASLAAVVILLTGWTRADPLLSLLIAGLIARMAVRLLRRSAHILMEGTPEGLDTRELAQELRRAVTGIDDVHHVHAWSLGSSDVLVTLHARLTPGHPADRALGDVKAWLLDRYAIRHSTIQLEQGGCADAGDRPASSAPAAG